MIVGFVWFWLCGGGVVWILFWVLCVCVCVARIIDTYWLYIRVPTLLLCRFFCVSDKVVFMLYLLLCFLNINIWL